MTISETRMGRNRYTEFMTLLAWPVGQLTKQGIIAKDTANDFRKVILWHGYGNDVHRTRSTPAKSLVPWVWQSPTVNEYRRKVHTAQSFLLANSAPSAKALSFAQTTRFSTSVL